MDDVVEQGRRDRSGPPRWLRGSTLGLALAIGVLIVTRPHLLFADAPVPDHPTAPPTARTPPAGENTSQGISIVVRQGDRLERYEAGSGSRPLATLPKGLPDPAQFVHAPLPGGSGPLVGVNRGVLFAISPARRSLVTPIGRAVRILAPSPEPGRLFVLKPAATKHRGPRAVEIDALTGDITKQQPFPGYDRNTAWRPINVVPSPSGGSALLLAKAVRGGQAALALAWDGLSINLVGAPTLARIGVTYQVLGVAQTRILATELPAGCPERRCPMTVLSVTSDRVLTRTVEPPPGWTYGSTVVGGDGGDPIAVVSRIGDPSRLALARLVVGARSGLLVAGSDGLVASVRPVAGSDGSVVFALPRPEGVRLTVWQAGSPSAALLLDLPALADGAELVCTCR